MRLLRVIAITLAMAGTVPAVAVPFVLPPGAELSESPDGKGWQASGTLPISFKSAEKRLASAAAAAGWLHLHTIPLGRDRTLDAWIRGSQELTVMTWRLSPGKSGFSYGVTDKSGVATGPKKGVRKPRRRGR